MLEVRHHVVHSKLMTVPTMRQMHSYRYVAFDHSSRLGTRSSDRSKQQVLFYLVKTLTLFAKIINCTDDCVPGIWKQMTKPVK